MERGYTERSRRFSFVILRMVVVSTPYVILCRTLLTRVPHLLFSEFSYCYRRMCLRDEVSCRGLVLLPSNQYPSSQCLYFHRLTGASSRRLTFLVPLLFRESHGQNLDSSCGQCLRPHRLYGNACILVYVNGTPGIRWCPISTITCTSLGPQTETGKSIPVRTPKSDDSRRDQPQMNK